MALKLYNTLTREKEAFKPLDRSNVRMYVCGPTVYDYAHIGNARPVIVFDVLFRLLRHSFGPDHVTYVRNITDVDDKINARAAEDYPDLPLNEAIRIVTEKTGNQFHADVAALGCLPPTMEPRATEHIAEMMAMIEKLVERGCAYVAEDHALFDVSGMQDYGKLSRRSLDEMIAGARVEVAPFKRDPMDFVLWKPSKPDEPSWKSPSGIATPGRPGWHIECSAMSWKHLGETFDIHGGGIDLLFPHHENEIAQSRCAHGTKTMANYWLHNGFLQVEGQKMSKSLGNFVTIHELLEQHGGRWSGDVLRYNMLRAHYREPFNWTEKGLAQSHNELLELQFCAVDYIASEPDNRFLEALCDDLNTPLARARLFELKDAAKRGDDDAGRRLRASMELYGFPLGAVDFEPRTLIVGYGFSDLPEEALISILASLPGDVFLGQLQRAFVEKFNASEIHEDELPKGFLPLLKSIEPGLRVRDVRYLSGSELRSFYEKALARNAARKAKDFAKADRIRDELTAMGIELKDAKDSKTGELVTTWEVAR